MTHDPTGKAALRRAVPEYASAQRHSSSTRLLDDPTSGRPLDAALRAEMEQRLGADLSGVRLHIDARAAVTADALCARAYTIGADVVFGPGEFRPTEPSGRRLLAHELSHVVQQQKGGTRPAGSAVSEREAAGVADGRISPAQLGGSGVGIAREAKAPVDDSLGFAGDLAVDWVSGQLVGQGFSRAVVSAALRGFVAEMGRQVTSPEQVARLRSALAELRRPANVVDLAAGWTLGATAGLISPVTDLLGLAALVERLPQIAEAVTRWGLKEAGQLGQQASALAEAFQAFDKGAREQVHALLKDPAALARLAEQLGPRVVAAAGAAGRTVAAETVAYFTGPEKPQEAIDLGAAAQVGVVNLAMAGAELAKNKIVVTKWSKLGYKVGHAVGATVSQLLLFLFSDGIGNAITKISGALGELVPVLAKVFNNVAKVGEGIAAAEKAVAELIAKGISMVKPLENIAKPVFQLLEQLRRFLRGLLGVTEREGPALAAAAAARAERAVAEKLAPVTKSAGPVAPSGAAGAIAARGEGASTGQLVPLTKTGRPPSAATRSLRQNLERTRPGRAPVSDLTERLTPSAPKLAPLGGSGSETTSIRTADSTAPPGTAAAGKAAARQAAQDAAAGKAAARQAAEEAAARKAAAQQAADEAAARKAGQQATEEAPAEAAQVEDFAAEEALESAGVHQEGELKLASGDQPRAALKSPPKKASGSGPGRRPQAAPQPVSPQKPIGPTRPAAGARQPAVIPGPTRPGPGGRSPAWNTPRKGWISLGQERANGSSFVLRGSGAEVQASQQGFQVYEYLSEDGARLYVGKSGGLTGATPSTWVDRGWAHLYEKPAISQASFVRVTSNLSHAEAAALEWELIDNLPYKVMNEIEGFPPPGQDLAANIRSAAKAPVRVFRIEMVPPPGGLRGSNEP